MPFVSPAGSSWAARPLPCARPPLLVLLLTLVLASLWAAGPAAAQPVRWSEASTWPGGPPRAGDDVTIPEGQTILLDEAPPALGHLRIEGTLRFEDARDLSLTADWILVEGRLEVGTEADPFAHEAVITLTGTPDDSLRRVGGKFLAAMPGAHLELHGAARDKRSWTQLDATAGPGATAITLLEEPTGWAPGDDIVIAPTSIDPAQAEQVTITGVSGRRVSFVEPLQYRHFGELQRFGSDPERVLDQRAEVGLLTRNIRIQGDAASATDGYGGHLMVAPGAVAHIEGVEAYRMGQKGRLGRYPLHWHRNGDVKGEYARHNSIHHGYNRCITTHGTDNHLVEDNVGYNNIGHCFFLEDGTETGNLVKDNLALYVRRAAEGEGVLETDRYPAAFWTSNPNNRYIGNTAAGSEGGFGFWFGLADFSNALNVSTNVEWGTFRSNTAHSNTSGGRDFRRGGMGLFVDRHNAETRALVEDFTSYKNENKGLWAGHGFHLDGGALADNRLSAFGSNMLVEDALIVGRSASLTGAELRRLRHTEGLQLYDGYMSLKDATAANFPGKHGVIGWRNLKASSNYYPPSFIENVEFVDARPVYLVPSYYEEKEPARTYALRDRDGSITGTPGYVVYNAPIQVEEDCTVHEEWRAAFCPDPGYFVPVKMNIGKKWGHRKDLEFVRKADGAVGFNSNPSTKLPGGQAYEVRLTSDAMRDSYARAHRHSAEIWSIDETHWIELDVPWTRSAAFLYARKGSYSKNNSDLRDPNDRYPSVGSTAALAESDATSYYIDEEARQLRMKVFPTNEDRFIRYAHGPPAYRTILKWCDRVRCRGPEVEGTEPPAYAEGEGAGLTGQYFANDDFTALRTTRTDRGVAFDWNEGAALDLPPEKDYSVRWSGQVEAPASAQYTMTVTHGEDVRLWIDGKSVIDAWESSRFLNTSSGTIRLEAGQRYDLRMEYRGGSHEAAAQLEWAYGAYESHTVPAAQLYPNESAARPLVLDEAWQRRDVGDTEHTAGVAGSDDGTFTVRGAGHDIGGRVDRFYFAYQVLTGDGTITARVVSQDSMHEQAKAGVMIRSTLAGEARNAFMAITPGHGLRFQRRLRDGDETEGTSAFDEAAPYWVRLERTGSRLIGSLSPDGREWTAVDTARVALPEDVFYAGLAVTSHDEQALSTATFDEVRVTGFEPIVEAPLFLTELADLRVAQIDGPNQAPAVQLTWQTLTENGSAGFRVERSAAGQPFERAGFVETKAEGGLSSEPIRYTFSDIDPPDGVQTVRYRLVQRDADGSETAYGPVEATISVAPEAFRLQAGPTPFRTSTTLTYQLKHEARVTLAIYDALGRKVRTLVRSEQQAAGRRAVRFQADGLASGIYFARLLAEAKSGLVTRTRKLVLVR